jgi:hypothetical protein
MCLSQDRHGDVDLQDLHDRLVMASPRLFSGQGDIEVWRRSKNNEGMDTPNSRLPWLIHLTETIAQSVFDPVSPIHGQKNHFINY